MSQLQPCKPVILIHEGALRRCLQMAHLTNGTFSFVDGEGVAMVYKWDLSLQKRTTGDATVEASALSKTRLA